MKRGIIIATVMLLVILPTCKAKSNEEKIEELENKLENATTDKEIEIYIEKIEKLQQAAKENAKNVTIKLGQPFSFWVPVSDMSSKEDMTQFSMTFKNIALTNEDILGMRDEDKNKKCFMILARVINLGPRKSWHTPSGEDIQIKTNKGYLYRTGGYPAMDFFQSEPPFPLDWKKLDSWKHGSIDALEPEENGWVIYRTLIPEDNKPIEIIAQFPVEAGSSGGRKLTNFNLKITQTGEIATKTEKQINLSPEKQKEGETTGFFKRLFRPWWGKNKDKNKETSAQQKQGNNIPASSSNLTKSDKTTTAPSLTSETSKSNDSIQNQTEVTKEQSIGETFRQDEQRLKNTTYTARPLKRPTAEKAETNNLGDEVLDERTKMRNTARETISRRQRTPRSVATNTSKNEIEQVRELINNKTNALPEIPKYLLDEKGNNLLYSDNDYYQWYQIAQGYQALAKIQLKWAGEILSKGDCGLANRYINESDNNVRIFHSAKFALDAIYKGNAGQAEYYKKEVYENSRAKFVFTPSYTVLGPLATGVSDCLYAAVDITVNTSQNEISSSTRQTVINIITQQL